MICCFFFEIADLHFSLVHSFIIDTEDTFIKSEFTEEEISEIVEKNNEKNVPEIDERILEYINAFAKAGIIDLVICQRLFVK